MTRSEIFKRTKLKLLPSDIKCLPCYFEASKYFKADFDTTDIITADKFSQLYLLL